jgi:hypothetical protein
MRKHVERDLHYHPQGTQEEKRSERRNHRQFLQVVVRNSKKSASFRIGTFLSPISAMFVICSYSVKCKVLAMFSPALSLCYA